MLISLRHSGILTLRQLYYQLVSRNIIPNQERAYKNLSRLLTRARLAGLVDWSSIEDRVRTPAFPPEFGSLADLIEAAIYSYRLPRLEGQDHYVELWVEKDALASVLRPIAMKYHVVLMVNRGYSSASSMYDSARRFIAAQGRHNWEPYLFYLGDLDPSGEDMVRDIRSRFDEFGVGDVVVKKIALTPEQVEEYSPPPNPAKMRDPRAEGFVSKFGSESWEVDALHPSILERLIGDAIENVLDLGLMAEVEEREERDKEALKRLAEREGSE